MEVQSPQSNFPRDHRDPTDIASRGSLVRLSPEEPFHAWIFCAAASIRNGDDQLQPWLEMIVAIPLEFRLLEEKKDIFWAQVAEREALGHKFGAMFRTPSGRILEIVHFAEAESARLHRTLSREDIAKAWEANFENSELSDKVNFSTVDPLASKNS